MKHSPLPSGGGASPLLVNRSISQQLDNESFLVYPSAVRICRKKYEQKPFETPPPVRSDISGFSDKSRRNLRFLAGNTSVKLISQFCLTYHELNPDGKTCKQHLNSWLQRVRTRFPEVHYLWVLEFQTRGVPHFHVWLNLPSDTPGLRNILAVSWNKIVEPGNETHLSFHKHKSNFIPWDMYNSSYLTKYLDKECQKKVPENFRGCGRFWGNSRNLLAIPQAITAADLEHLIPETYDTETGEITSVRPFPYIVRTLGKLHEKKLKGTPWRSRFRTGLANCTLQTSAPQFRQIISYLEKIYQDETNLPF